MPFLIPIKRSSVTKSTRFSKYKDIADSPYFVLQKRKSAKVSKSANRATYRIITKGVNPYYEVAYDFDLESISAREWNYITNDLMRIIPAYLTPKTRLKWLLAHFTQLALENDNNSPAMMPETDDEDETGDKEAPGTPPLTGMSSTVSSPVKFNDEKKVPVAKSPVSASSAGSSSGGSLSPPMPYSPSSPFSKSPTASAPAFSLGPSYPLAASFSSGPNGLASSEPPTSGSDDNVPELRSRGPRRFNLSRMRPNSTTPLASSSSSPAAFSARNNLMGPSALNGASFMLRGKKLCLVLMVFTNLCLLHVHGSPWSYFVLTLVLLNMILFALVVRGEPFSLGLVINPEQSSPLPSPSVSSAVTPLSVPRKPSPTPITVRRPQMNIKPQAPKASASATFHGSMSGEDEHVFYEENPEAFTPRTMEGSSLSTDEAELDMEGEIEGDEVEIDDEGDMSSALEAVEPGVKEGGAVVESGKLMKTLPVTRLKISQTISRCDPSNPNNKPSWDVADGASFSVRCGPNYKRNHLKALSGPALYEMVGCDVFKCEQKADHIMTRLRKPPIPSYCWPRPDDPTSLFPHLSPEAAQAAVDVMNDEKSNPVGWLPTALGGVGASWDDTADCTVHGIPPIFVVQWQLPSYAPNNPVWGATREDGEGYAVMMYFVATKEGWEQIKAQETAATRLFKRFVAADGDVEFRNRFKAIPRIMNPDELNLGSVLNSSIRKYNSKPFLTGPHCHDFLKGHNYMEADIDVHRFCYLARKAAHGMLPTIKDFVVDVAFTVEGHADDELPEQTLLAGRISRVDTELAPDLEALLRAQVQAEEMATEQA